MGELHTVVLWLLQYKPSFWSVGIEEQRDRGGRDENYNQIFWCIIKVFLRRTTVTDRLRDKRVCCTCAGSHTYFLTQPISYCAFSTTTNDHNGSTLTKAQRALNKRPWLKTPKMASLQTKMYITVSSPKTFFGASLDSAYYLHIDY